MEPVIGTLIGLYLLVSLGLFIGTIRGDGFADNVKRYGVFATLLGLLILVLACVVLWPILFGIWLADQGD